MNLKDMREHLSTLELVEYVEKNWKSLNYPDQSLINKLFQDKIKILNERKYNCQVNCHHYSGESIILENALIIHFAGANQRPWEYSFRKYYGSAVNGEVWWYYARKCGWKKYFKWRVCNWLQVRPWQIICDIYRTVKSSLTK